jgi:signal transduction histidine kinase
MRWGWRGTLSTAAFVMFEYLIMGASMSRTLGGTELGLNRFIVRGVYLAITAWLLVYLGRYETRMRQEIERLARWPATTGADISEATSHIMRHASQIVGAARSVAFWEASEEPAIHVAEWSPSGTSYSKQPPGRLKPYVVPALEEATFFCAGDFRQRAELYVNFGRGRQGEWSGVPLNTDLLEYVKGTSLTSAPFRTGSVTGRVFFSDLEAAATETLPLTALVAREIGGSLDQLNVTKQLQEVAAGEERIRLARDLHDGVLQSLTGVRLEIRAVAGLEGLAAAIRDRLVAIERALAGEQRELRFFIADLEPDGRGRDDSPLAHRLQALLKRIALEWKTPVTIRVADEIAPVSQRIEQAVPLMVHEAVVNALKHGHPSRVTVAVEGTPGEIKIVVADDGRGFPFRGRYNHSALVEGHTGPKSLIDRVTALGGELSIESSEAGARVELRLST